MDIVSLVGADFTVREDCPPGYNKSSTLDVSQMSSLGWRAKIGVAEMVDRMMRYYREPGAREPQKWV